MDLPQPLTSGTWVKRYKRFLLDVELDSGELVTVHCANPGSMQGCSDPGTRVLLSHHDEPHRKLSWSLQLVRAGRVWVGVHTGLTNRIAREALDAGMVPDLDGYASVRPEVTHGKSRFDFLLQDPRRGSLWLEVKNVSLVENGVAMFPDAVTARGARHVEELAQAVSRGDMAAVLFVVQRSDAREFRPAAHIDPGFARALDAAHRAGVSVHSLSCSVSPKRISCVKPLPVHGIS